MTISGLFSVIVDGITAFVGALGQALSGVTALFWDSTAATPGPTVFGMLLLIFVSVSLTLGAYSIIKGLIHNIGTK